MHPATTTETSDGAVEPVRRRGRGPRRDRGEAAGPAPPTSRPSRARRPRPGRTDIDQAALHLIARHGAKILATARRYAATPEDAEDAYQHGLEILLRKAPTTSQEDLVPWLKTAAPPPRAARPGHRRRRARGARDASRHHARPGRALPAAASGRRGAAPAQAAGDTRAPAEGRGLLLRGDLRDHRVVVHKGQPLPDGGRPGLGHQVGGDRGRDRVRQAGAAADGAGRRRRADRAGGAAAAAHEELSQLSRSPQVSAGGLTDGARGRQRSPSGRLPSSGSG
jgi:hypothetical protein